MHNSMPIFALNLYSCYYYTYKASQKELLMKIDYCSDPHFDAYFNPNRPLDEKAFRAFYEPFIFAKGRTPGEVLVIAGDLSHENTLSLEALKLLKRYYSRIVCVLGNHDYYLSSARQHKEFSDSFERVETMRARINSQEGLHCLDGTVVTINGVRFGGCDSWYNSAYEKHYFLNRVFTQSSTNEMWKKAMMDAKFIKGVEDFDAIFAIEKPKLDAVYASCDVMLTHVNPSFKKAHLDPSWKNDPTSVFFSFGGHEYLKEGTMQYWIFGHTHTKIQYELHGVSVLCNPIGYPGEPNQFRMESFEIDKGDIR